MKTQKLKVKMNALDLTACEKRLFYGRLSDIITKFYENEDNVLEFIEAEACLKKEIERLENLKNKNPKVCKNHQGVTLVQSKH